MIELNKIHNYIHRLGYGCPKNNQTYQDEYGDTDDSPNPKSRLAAILTKGVPQNSLLPLVS
jgi:hypothetical protein